MYLGHIRFISMSEFPINRAGKVQDKLLDISGDLFTIHAGLILTLTLCSEYMK